MSFEKKQLGDAPHSSRDIALFALGKACITAKAGFGHFSSVGSAPDRDGDTPEQFKKRFAANCRRISAMVFDNGKECAAHQGDIVEIAPQVKADLAYFDPPYATQFSNVHYERSYHFIEGLMTYWKDKELREDTKTKIYSIPANSITPKNAEQFLGACAHIPNWLISYRNQDETEDVEVSIGADKQLEIFANLALLNKKVRLVVYELKRNVRIGFDDLFFLDFSRQVRDER